MRWLLPCLVLSACSGNDTDVQDTDVEGPGPPPAGCLRFAEAQLEIVSEDGAPVAATVHLENACGRELQAQVGWAIAEEVLVLEAEAEPVLLADAETLSVSLRYAPVPGDPPEALLRATTSLPGVDDATLRITGSQPAPRYQLQGELVSVPQCPTPVRLELSNLGEGLGQVEAVELPTAHGLFSAVTLPGAPVDLRPGDPPAEVLATLTLPFLMDPPGDATVRETFLGDVAVGLPAVTLDMASMRLQSVPAWSAGLPVDVLLTVDRELPGDWRGAVTTGLETLLRSLKDQGRDYRVGGLRKSDGCLLGAGPADTAMGVTDGVARLTGQLDLGSSRVTDTTYDPRPFDLVYSALSPDSTCNGWLRHGVPLLVVQVTARDDRSTVSLTDLKDAVARHVAAPGDVVVNAIAGDDGTGCEGIEAVPRLDAIISHTGGLRLSLCNDAWMGQIGRVAEPAGDPQRVALDEAPHVPSLQVWKNGVLETRWTWDGYGVVLPVTAYEPLSDALEIAYATAESCPY